MRRPDGAARGLGARLAGVRAGETGRPAMLRTRPPIANWPVTNSPSHQLASPNGEWSIPDSRFTTGHLDSRTGELVTGQLVIADSVESWPPRPVPGAGYS